MDENVFRTDMENTFNISYDPPGDGDCFFHCIINALALSDNSSKLRKRAINYLKENLDKYQNFFEGNGNDFIKKMAKKGEYADHVLIHCTSQITNYKFVIISSDGADHDCYMEPDCYVEGTDIYLGHYVQSQHYVVLNGQS